VTRVGLKVHRTFHALGHSRNYRLFFSGQIVSVSGTWMQQVAAAWLVLRLTGSGVALGIDTALAFGPMLLFGALGGTIADRHDKRKILIGTQVAFGLLAIALWAIVATDVVQLWMVYALSFVQGVVTSIDNPTRQSFFSEMVREEDLPNAVSLNGAVMTGTRIIGPALAGVLIAGVGLAWCFLINAVSYLAVIGALLAMREHELTRNRAPRERGAIREGFRYVWRTDALRRPLLLMSVLYLFAFNYAVLMPLYAERTLGGDAGTLALLLSVMGIGSLAGALVMASQARPATESAAMTQGMSTRSSRPPRPVSGRRGGGADEQVMAPLSTSAAMGCGSPTVASAKSTPGCTTTATTLSHAASRPRRRKAARVSSIPRSASSGRVTAIAVDASVSPPGIGTSVPMT